MRAFLARLSNGTAHNNDHHPSTQVDSQNPAVLPKLKTSEKFHQDKENLSHILPSRPPSLGPIPTVSTPFGSEPSFCVPPVTTVVPLRSVSPSCTTSSSASPMKPIGRGNAPSTVRIGPPPFSAPPPVRRAQAERSKRSETVEKPVSVTPALPRASAGLASPSTPALPPSSSSLLTTQSTETKLAKSETLDLAAQLAFKPAVDHKPVSRPSSCSSQLSLSVPSTSPFRTREESVNTTPHVSIISTDPTSSSLNTVKDSSVFPGSNLASNSVQPIPSACASPTTVPAPVAGSSRTRPVSAAMSTTGENLSRPRPKSAMSSDSRPQAPYAAGRSSRMSGSFHRIDERGEETDADTNFVSAPESWSQWADEDLLMNLGPRERTRQEVLWEIISSEDRYVTDLENLLSTFINALLPSSPMMTSSPPVVPLPISEQSHSPIPVDHLPIAARFSTPLTELSPMTATGRNKEDSPRSSVGRTAGSPSSGSSPDTPSDPFPVDGPNRSRSALSSVRLRHSLPPDKHSSVDRPLSSLSSSSVSRTTSRKLHRVLSHVHLYAQPNKTPTTSNVQSVKSSSNVDILGLPRDLKTVLEILRDGILPGHRTLCRALKRRHEEQFPLVRSLADVFTQHSYVLRAYTTYILHLSDALRTVDQALMSSSPSDGKRKKEKKSAEDEEFERLKGIFQELDELAADRGQSGLAISLSKPFQRLVKYPLLLQNLLYNTDPSTKEYEATLSMVDEVEHIIRSIEDEKTTVEERVKTRDVFARIEGLEREKMLMIPNPSRLVLEEYPCSSDGSKISATTITTNSTAVRRPTSVQTKSKKTDKNNIRKIGEILRPGNSSGSGTTNDLWIVRFNDVSLLCQRTGTTSLPLASASSRSPSLPELNAPSKMTAQRRRPHQIKPRNLYRFIKLEGWTMANAVPSRHRPTSAATLGKGRASTVQPLTGSALRAHDERNRGARTDENKGEESDGSSDTKSQMSFTYRGDDTVQPTPASAPRPGSSASRRILSSSLSTAAPRAGNVSAQTRRSSSSAQDKFGSRLRSPELQPGSARSGSRARSNGATSAAGMATKRAVTPAVGRSHSSASSTPSIRPQLRLPNQHSPPN